MKIRNVTACALAIAVLLISGCASTPEAKEAKFLAAGKKYFDKKDYARAILDFQNAAKIKPKDPNAYYQLGLAAEAVHDIQTAVNAYQYAVSLDPKRGDAQFRLARIMASTTDPAKLEEAETLLHLLLTDSAQDPEMLDTLALAELKTGKLGEAILHLNQAIAAAPQAIYSTVLLAQAKISQRDFAGAESVLVKACESNPKSADFQVLLGEFYLSRKMQAEAGRQFQNALNLDSKNGPALLELAKLQAAQSQNDDAEKTFKRLAALGDHTTRPLHAIFLFQSGKRDAAIREFEEILKESPMDRAARSRLVGAYQATGRDADALLILDQAIKKSDRDTDALTQRADMYVRQRKFELAEADLNRALHSRSNIAQVHYVFAKLYAARGSILLERQELAEAVRLIPASVPVRVEFAQVLLRTNAAQRAFELLNETPAYQRQSLPIVVQRNWALWSLGRIDELRQGVKQGLALQRTPDLLIQEGLVKLADKDFAGARVSLEEALHIDSQDIRALDAIRRSYMAQKQSAAAVQKVKEYAAKFPNSPNIQQFLGNVLASNGESAAARNAFETALRSDRQFIAADMSLVQLDYADRKYDSARKRLTAELSANPEDASARLWLSNLDASQGQYDTAVAGYRQALTLDPANPQTLNNLAYLLVDKKQIDEGLKYAEQAHQLAPVNPHYADTLGWIYYKKGLYKMAVNNLETAAAQPENATWKYHLAMAYAKAGYPDRAKSTLSAALRQDPASAVAEEARQVIAGAK